MYPKTKISLEEMCHQKTSLERALESVIDDLNEALQDGPWELVDKLTSAAQNLQEQLSNIKQEIKWIAGDS